MSTRCLWSAAPSSSVSELSQPRQQYLVFLAPSKGLAWGQRETNPTGRGMVFCRRSALKQLRAGAKGGFGGCQERCDGLAFFAAAEMGGVGQMKWLLWPVETSGKTRADGEGEVGWRRGGGMCGVTGAGSKGRRRVGASRAADLPMCQQGVMASRIFILGLLPGLKTVVWLVRSIRLRVLTGPDGQPVACLCMPALPEILATSCSPGGGRGKDALGWLAISSCERERISRLRTGGGKQSKFFVVACSR